MRILRRPPPALAAVLLVALGLIPGITAQTTETSPAIPDLQAVEAQPELFTTALSDTEVSLSVIGSWKGTLTGNWGIALTPLGAMVAAEETPILFVQETDLTLSLWVRDRWFLETSFLDDYALNTYRAGYQGDVDDTVQYLGIGNTGLDFPVFPYLDLGGDAPNSFGVYGRFGTGPLALHALFRYDAAVREEKIFQGDRERTQSDLAADAFLRGRSFVLPDTALDNVPVVYLEDADGDLPGSDGRRWRRAAAAEYSAGAAYGLVELATAPTGRVAVAYAKDGSPTPWDTSLGTYTGSGFLNESQDAFTAANPDIDLSAYPQPGSDTDVPADITINGTPALVIYEKGAFSPFERLGRYAAASGGDAALVRASTGDVVRGYEVLPLAEASAAQDPVLADADQTTLGHYEVLPVSGASDRRSVLSRWPLLAQVPEAYLPGSRSANADLALRFTRYGAVGAYGIGTDAIAGSVQVFRNGILDPLARYDAESGTVLLSTPASATETIRISYLKRADERRFGSVAAGLGAEYDPEGPFSAAAALGVRWNVAVEAYSEEGSPNPGSVGFGGRLSWDREQLQAGLTLGLGYEQTDTTGLYRAAGMEGAELALDFPETGFFISEPLLNLYTEISTTLSTANQAPLVYRNYSVTDLLGITSLKPVEYDAPIVSGQQGPYRVADEAIDSPVLVAEFSLDAAETWTGFQVPLDAAAGALATAKELKIPFRFYDFNADANFAVYVQFGALAEEGSGGFENPALVVSKSIFSFTAPDTPPTAWSLATVSLNDDDRRRLGDADYLRLIVRQTGPGSASGRVLLAPPVVVGARFRPIVVDGDVIATAPDDPGAGVATLEVPDSSLRSAYPDLIDRLHPGSASQRVLQVAWEGLITPGRAAGADGRTGALPLADYRKLSFFVKGPKASDDLEAAAMSAASLRFLVAREPTSLQAENVADAVFLDVRVPAAAFSPGRWSQVTVDYAGSDPGVDVDGTRVAAASLDYRPLDFGEAPPSYVAVFLVPASGSLPDGTFSLDEIVLEDPAPSYRANLGGSVAWENKGPLVSYRGFPLLADVAAEAVLESALQGDPVAPQASPNAQAAGRTSFSAALVGARIGGDLCLSADRDDTAWSAGHRVELPLGPFSLKDEFSTAPENFNLRHLIRTGLALPVNTTATAEMDYASETLRRSWGLSLAYSSGDREGALPLNLMTGANAAWTETGVPPETWAADYAAHWVKSGERLVPDLGAEAARRDADWSLSAAVPTRPLGLDLSLSGESAVARAAGTESATTGAVLAFPLELSAWKIRLQAARRINRVLLVPEADFRDDLRRYAESVADYTDLWLTVPGYTLGDARLGTTLDQALLASGSGGSTDALLFSDSLALDVQLPRRDGPSALIIPGSFAANAERRLERKLDTLADSLGAGGSFDFSAINLFGAFGSHPLVAWYQSDEFSHRLEWTGTFPRDAAAEWSLRAGQSLAFFGFLGSRLGITHTFAWTAGTWTDSAALDWTAPAEKSLLGVIYDAVTAKFGASRTSPALAELAAGPTERLRKEAIQSSVDLSGEGVYGLSLGHESIVRIPGRLYLSAFAVLGLDQNVALRTFTFTGSVGTTLKITY